VAYRITRRSSPPGEKSRRKTEAGRPGGRPAWAVWAVGSEPVAAEPHLLEQAGMGPLLLLAHDEDGGLEQDEQRLLLFGLDAVREEPVEDGELGEDGHAGLDLELGDQALAADEQRALVGDGDRRADAGDGDRRELDE